jgi:AcrR family transcriptional regulator
VTGAQAAEEHGGRRGPGRPATIGADAFVGAAIAVIDEVGVDGLTMRVLADRLGVSPMSVYRHVESKEDLLRRIPDSLLAGVAADVGRRRRALPALRAVAVGLGDVLERHPGVAALFHRPEPGPNMLAAAAHCVDLLVREGCPEDEAFEILRSLVALVIGQSVTSHGERSGLGVRIFLAGAAGRLRSAD